MSSYVGNWTFEQYMSQQSLLIIILSVKSTQPITATGVAMDESNTGVAYR